MGRAYSRTEYKGMVANFVVVTIIASMLARIGRVLFTGIFAKRAQSEGWDPNDAWHILTNESTWSRVETNWTATNESVPEYWTPPEQWRIRCMATNGAPIASCSYFQYEEFPGFMALFFVTYYFFVLIMTALHVLALYRLCMMLAASFKCFSKSERRCTQMSTVLLILLFSRLLSGIIFPDWYLLWGEGAGLVNSFGSGKMYLGAGWNKSPFPTPKEVLDATSGTRKTPMWNENWPEYPFSVYGLLMVSNSKLYHFASVINGPFGTCPVYSDLGYILMIIDKMVRTYNIIMSQELAGSSSPYAGLLFEPVIPWNKCSAWKKMYRTNGPFLIMYVGCFAVLALPWTVRSALEQMRGVNFATEQEGQQELADWWAQVQGLTRVTAFIMLFEWLFLAVWLPSMIAKKKKLTEKVGVSEAYKARTRLVENTLTQCKWIIAAGVMFNLSLLPSSLMIMYYGFSENNATSLTDGFFGVAGSTPTRMLAAPLLRFLYYLVFLIMFFGGLIKGSPIYIKGI